jgi:hypothetical protein
MSSADSLCLLLEVCMTEIVVFYSARPENHLDRAIPSPKFTFNNVTHTRPKPDFLLFQPE